MLLGQSANYTKLRNVSSFDLGSVPFIEGVPVYHNVINWKIKHKINFSSSFV